MLNKSYIKTIALILILVFSLLGCGESKNTTKIKDEISGNVYTRTWSFLDYTLSEAYAFDESDYSHVIITILPDLQTVETKEKGTYRIKDDKIELTSDEDEKDELTYSYVNESFHLYHNDEELIQR